MHEAALSDTARQAVGVADQLTVMILIHNEEPNIARTLDAIKWAGQILIVDSCSTDATLDIVARYSQARVVTTENHLPAGSPPSRATRAGRRTICCPRHAQS